MADKNKTNEVQMVDYLLKYKTKNSETVRSICFMPSDLSYNNAIVAVGEDLKVHGYLLC